MEKNNGKIAIAIVAMFVVALSIVGFTYAYFVADVTRNTGDKAVEVQAGILKIKYENGTTLTATNIVPGWISNDDMIYDPVHSIKTVGGQTQISAVSKSALGDTVSDDATEPVKALKFDVTDASTKGETAYYGIRLVNVTNGLYGKVGEVDIPETEHDDLELTLTGTNGVNVTYKLTDAKTQYIYPTVIEISTDEDAENATKHAYTLSAHYVNEGEQKAQGVSMAFTVDVIGLQEVSEGNYVTADGTSWSTLIAG